jgi:hypothetical protein
MEKESKNDYYNNNKEKMLSRQKEKYEILSKTFNEWKSTLKCMECDEIDPNCLDFHHIDSNEKEYNMKRAVAAGAKTVIKELKKCVVVCSNCHRKIHAYNKKVLPDEVLANSFDKFVGQLQHQY